MKLHYTLNKNLYKDWNEKKKLYKSQDSAGNSCKSLLQVAEKK